MGATCTWYGHGTFRFDLPDGRVMFVDPWLENNPACPDDLKKLDRLDMIVLTHGHFDHAEDVPRLIKDFNPKIVCNIDLSVALTKVAGGGEYSPMNTGGTQVCDGVRVSLTPAWHSSAIHTDDGPIYAGMPNGVVVSTDDLAPVYHAGDTDVFGDMNLIPRLFAPAVSILPIGDYFTMGAKGGAIAAELLQPSVIMPIHYGTFPILDASPAGFMENLKPDLHNKVLHPEIGDPMDWTKDGIHKRVAV